MDVDARGAKWEKKEVRERGRNKEGRERN